MSDADEDFEDSPRPLKRRRTLQTHAREHPSDQEASSPPRKDNRGSRRQRRDSNDSEQPKTAKAPKTKHRVHVHTDAFVEINDIEASQLPEGPPSSPWRIRGAIWQKPRPLEEKDLNTAWEERNEQNDASKQLCIPRETPAGDCAAHLPTLDASPSPAPATARLPSPVYQRPSAPDVSQVIIHRKVQRNPIAASMPQGPPTSPMDTAPRDISNDGQAHEGTESYNVDDDLADLPSDAFESSAPPSPAAAPATAPGPDDILYLSSSEPKPPQVLRAPQSNLRQTTLFGGRTSQEGQATQAAQRRNFVADARQEKPTHHALNLDCLNKYIYPTNLGSFRQYQFNIVQTALQHNTLVALPTGLGKTFIAATVMLNWYRWTKDSQIVFVAPTKPLVAQQVEACFQVAGIPKSDTSMLTGGIAPGLRAEEWRAKRVFFMTPQTMINDLKTGIADPKRTVLLVVDEAHRATGGYAYIEVVKIIRQFNPSFRILALTATPGNNVETVQMVIDGLDIARVEIRTELSLDIREYVHSRNVDRKVFDNSEELTLIMDFFSKALQPLVDKLQQLTAYSRLGDAMKLSAFGLLKARQDWMGSPAGRNANAAVKGMVNRIFTVLQSLAHSITLLKYHGLGPFYHKMIEFQNGGAGQKIGKYETDIMQSGHFMKMMSRLRMWINNEQFIGHPKLEFLQELVLDHFQNATEPQHGAGNGDAQRHTRVMIFAQYRDSAEEIVRVLKRNSPMIRPHVFVGQAASKTSEGMDQKRQLEVIKDFKDGKYNTIVATSIGEEGLDIGEVDLIVCYDASASPIRMLQRMGRTGRKRAGNIMLLLMRGKEDEDFAKAKDSYIQMQSMIAKGDRFTYHHDRSPRILPFGCKPTADKRQVEIPVENTQSGLPEPKKRGKAPKRPPKKFHMPDGVRTGFISAARIGDDEDGDDAGAAPRPRKPAPKKVKILIQDCPSLEDVLLTAHEEQELGRNYKDVAEGASDIVQAPRIQFDDCQSVHRPTHAVGHSCATVRYVTLLKALTMVSSSTIAAWQERADRLDLDDLCGDVGLMAEDKAGPRKPAVRCSTASAKPRESSHKKASKMPTTNPRRNHTRDDASDCAVEGVSSSPDLTPANMALPSQGISLGSDTSGEDEEDEAADSELAAFIDDEGESEDGEQMPSSPPFQRRPTGAGTSMEDSDVESLVSSFPEYGSALQKRHETQQAGARKRKVIDESESDV